MLMIVTSSVTGSVSAQDSIGTNSIVADDFQYSKDYYQKKQLSLSAYWRNVLGTDLGKQTAGFYYKLKDGEVSDISTIGFAANLTFNMNAKIGIVSGFEIVSYGGRATGNFDGHYTTSYIEGDNFIFNYVLKDYNEQQRLTLFSIPLMAKYSMSLFSDISTKYFIAAGVKVGIPLTKRATIKVGSLTTTGHFLREDELYSDFPEQGLVNDLTGLSRKTKMDFNIGLIAALETGFIFMSNENISAGASIFCDVGLNNLLKKDNKHLVEYQKQMREYLLLNSIMKTEHVSSVDIFSIGLKLSVNFNLDKKTRKQVTD
jgi:hypothetical protein